MDLKKKCEFIHKAYFGTKETSVINYFYLTGILGDCLPSVVATRLLSEGLYSSEKFHQLHREQRSAYINWKGNLK